MHRPCSSSAIGLALLAILIAHPVLAQDFSRPIRHQGFLVDGSGGPVDAGRDLGFALFAEAAGEALPLWSESHPAVAVKQGLFSVLLGSSEPLPLSLFNDSVILWLETSIGGAPLTPRIQLTSVPYASNASALGGIAAANWQTRVATSCGAGMAMRAISAEGVPLCEEAPTGAKGPAGDQGPPGPSGTASPGSVGSTELVDGAVTSTKLATGAVTTNKIAADFELDRERLTGVLGEETGFVLPDVLDNRILIEINGVMVDHVIVVAGPGAETEMIESYWGDGTVRHLPGLSQETHFAFEYAGPNETALQALHDNYLLGPGNRDLHDMSLILKNALDLEVLRWNLLEYGLSAIDPGTEGRMRYTFRQTQLPNNQTQLFQDGRVGPPSFGIFESRNPATDKRVEISGVVPGPYPAVEVDEAARIITLTYDWVEGCCIYDWYLESVAGASVLRAVSIIEEDVAGVETSRRNYFDTWPFRFQFVSGFGLDQKMKARIFLTFDRAEDAR